MNANITNNSISLLTASSGDHTAAYIVLHILLAFSVCGNTFLLVVMLREKEVERSPSTWYLCNLSLCDILHVLFIPVITEWNETLVRRLDFPFGTTGCKFIVPFHTYLRTTGVISLICIAKQGYQAILCLSSQHHTKRTTYRTILLAHVLGVVLACPMLLLWWLEVGGDGVTTCSVVTNSRMARVYIITLFVCQYVFPLFLIASLYASAWLQLNKRNKKMIRLSEEYEQKMGWVSQQEVRPIRNTKPTFCSHVSAIRHKQTKRTLAMFILVVLMFAVMQLPNHIIWLTSISTVNNLLYFFVVLTYVSPALNCWIYGMCNKRFRCAYVRILRLSLCGDGSADKQPSLLEKMKQNELEERRTLFTNMFEDHKKNFDNFRHLYNLREDEEDKEEEFSQKPHQKKQKISFANFFHSLIPSSHDSRCNNKRKRKLTMIQETNQTQQLCVRVRHKSCSLPLSVEPLKHVESNVREPKNSVLERIPTLWKTKSTENISQPSHLLPVSPNEVITEEALSGFPMETCPNLQRKCRQKTLLRKCNDTSRSRSASVDMTKRSVYAEHRQRKCSVSCLPHDTSSMVICKKSDPPSNSNEIEVNESSDVSRRRRKNGSVLFQNTTLYSRGNDEMTHMQPIAEVMDEQTVRTDVSNKEADQLSKDIEESAKQSHQKVWGNKTDSTESISLPPCEKKTDADLELGLESNNHKRERPYKNIISKFLKYNDVTFMDETTVLNM